MKSCNHIINRLSYLIIISLIFSHFLSCSRVPTPHFALIGEVSEPKQPETVEIYYTKKPSRNYREIGILSITSWRHQPDDVAIYNILRNAAAEKGADAIIVLESQPEISTNYVTKQSYGGKTYRAMAISFTN